MQLNVKDGEIESNDLAVLIPDGYGMTSSVDEWCPLANSSPPRPLPRSGRQSNGVKGRAIPVIAIAPQLIDRWRTVLNHHNPE